MQVIQQFDPSQASKGVIAVGAADQGSKMLLYNKSPYDLQLDFLNGSQSIAHAKQARVWTLDGDTKQINWTVPSSQSVKNPPQSIVQGELYNPDEPVEGVYPVQLDTQTDLSNNLIGQNQAVFVPAFGTQVNRNTLDLTSGSSPFNILIGKYIATNYLSGFTFSVHPTTAGQLFYLITIGGIVNGASMTYACTATTTNGDHISEIFTPAIPAYDPSAAITLHVAPNGTGTGQTYAVVMHMYQA